jgi:competence protein ComEC
LVAKQLTGYDPLIDTKVTLQVSANEDAVYAQYGQLTFVGVDIVNLETGQKLAGKIGIKGMGVNAIYQNDVLLVQGKLREGIGAYQGFMSYAQLETVERRPSLIADIRRQFAASTASVLPEPMASFGMGILIGQRANLPESIKDDLTHVGLTHIIAVSGANLTIMLEASRKLLGKRSKRLSIMLTLSLMAFFVLVAGNSPSIVRAAIVSMFSMAAAYYGRRTRPMLIISMVAAMTAYANPIYIWSDASWYLSFLAFFGVLMVSPLFHNRLPAIFQKSVLLSVVVESICAEIMSLPYVLYTFNQMSYVGLLANMVVVTFIPLAMLLSFIAALAGMFVWPIAGWFAWPAKFLLMYMLDVAHVIANIPASFRDGVALNLPGLILVYCVIAAMCLLLGFKDKVKNDTITDDSADFEPYKVLGRFG